MNNEPTKSGAKLLEIAKGMPPAGPKRVSTKMAISEYVPAITSLRTATHPHNWEQIAQMFASDQIKITRKPSTLKKAYDALVKEHAEKEKAAKAEAAKLAKEKEELAKQGGGVAKLAK